MNLKTTANSYIKIMESFQPDLFVDSKPGLAIFSTCNKYRYLLSRTWDESKPTIIFLMLNPSTANEQELDPTLTRCRDFAQRWGYGSMLILNCYALRSPYPQELYDALQRGEDIVGPDNDEIISKALLLSEMVIVGWGSHKPIPERHSSILKIIGQKAHSLNVNADGSPQHPLYIASTAKPKAYPVEISNLR